MLTYSHKEKSPAPWGPCGPIGPWEPLNPWGPIAPWDPLNPWGPVRPIGPWEPFTPGGPTGPGSLLTFSIWKEMHRFLSFLCFSFPYIAQVVREMKTNKGKRTRTTKICLSYTARGHLHCCVKDINGDYFVCYENWGLNF